MNEISREEFRNTLSGLIQIVKNLKKQQGIIIDEKEILLDIIEYLLFETKNQNDTNYTDNKNNNKKQLSSDKIKNISSIFKNIENSNNTDVSKVRKGGRKTTDPSMETLQKEFFKLLEKYEEEDKINKEEFLLGYYNHDYYNVLCDVLSNGQIAKDLSKIDFGFSNLIAYTKEDAKIYHPGENFIGFNITKTGLAYYGMGACNDGEDAEVFFILYYDGKKMRAYVPYLGNTYNSQTKAAFCCDYDEEYLESIGKNCDFVYDLKPNVEMMLYDIENRIEIDTKEK